MLFGSWIGRQPKWQSENADERLAAVGELPVEAPELLEIAIRDPSAEVRAGAVRRSADWRWLVERHAAESDATVRASIAARAGELVAGIVSAGAVADAPAALVPILPAPIVVATLRQLADPAQRAAVLAAVADDEALAAVAREGLPLDSRLAAIDRLRDESVCAALVRASRGHEKAIWRAAQNRLDALRTGVRRQHDAESLIEAMVGLAANEHPAANQLAQLDREWLALGSAAGERQGEFSAARARVVERLEAQAVQQQAAQRLVQALAELRARLPADGADAVRLADERGTLARLTTEWSAVVAGDIPRTTYQAWTAGRIEIEEKLVSLAADLERLDRRQAALDEAENALGTGHVGEARAALRRYSAMPPVRPSSARHRQEARHSALAARIESLPVAADKPPIAAPDSPVPTEAARPMLSAAEQAVADTLTRLTGALDAGIIADAKAADDALDGLLGARPKLGGALRRDIEAARHRLGELAGWERWGNVRAHEALCVEAESLVGSTLPPAEIARSVAQLRLRWKELDTKHGAASQSLWQRFDRACGRAYAPARQHFAEEAKKRAEQLALREAYCAAVDAELAEGLAEKPVKDLQRRVDTWRDGWRKMGPVDRSKWKAIEERFATAIGPAVGRIREAAKAGRGAREALIAEARAAGAKSVREAVAAVKDLQARWKVEATTTVLPRAEEQRLWEAFRREVDAIFARREAETEGARTREATAAQAKAQLLDEFEARVAGAGGSGPRASGAALAELDRQLAQAGRAGRAEEQKFAARRAELEGRVSALRESRRRVSETGIFDALAERAALARRAENGEDSTLVAEQWKALAALPGSQDSKVRGRFEAAIAGRRPTAEDFARAMTERRDCCLRAEILSGLESPAEDARARMALRVQYLSASVAGEASDRRAEFAALADRWHGLPGDAEPLLASRWTRALDAFVAAGTAPAAKADRRLARPERSR